MCVPQGSPTWGRLLPHWSFLASTAFSFHKGRAKQQLFELTLPCRRAAVEDALRESTQSPGQNVFLEPKTRK